MILRGYHHTKFWPLARRSRDPVGKEEIERGAARRRSFGGADRSSSVHAIRRRLDVGSLQALARPGIGALTYHETVGPAGTLEQEGDPEAQGITYPVHHVLGEVLELPEARLLAATFPEHCPVVALGSGDRLRVLMANLDDHPRAVRVRMPTSRGIAIRWLSRNGQTSDGTTATSDAEDVVRRGIATVNVRLAADELVRLDGHREGARTPSAGATQGGAR
jgi:hypothetical protein